MSNYVINHCRLCGESEYTEYHKQTLIKYGVRHYVHAECALKKWGAEFFDRLTPHQAERFPYMAAKKFGVVKELEKRINA